MQPSTFPSKITWLFRYLGPFRGMMVLLAKPIAVIVQRFSRSEWYWRFVESQFDSRHKVNTFEMVPIESLEITGEEQEQAVFYEPTPVMEFGYIISRLKIDFSDHTFIDVGSGKGRALLLASWFGFKRIMGVEISPKLHAIAEKNIANFSQSHNGCDNLEAVCVDATKFELPAGPLVLFLFNPFHAKVIEAFLQNLKQSLLDSPRKVTLLYGNPVHTDTIEANDWLRLESHELKGWFAFYEVDLDAIVRL